MSTQHEVMGKDGKLDFGDREDVSLRLCAMGDISFGGAVQELRFREGADSIFAAVKDDLKSADLRIGNLHSVLVERGQAASDNRGCLLASPEAVACLLDIDLDVATLQQPHPGCRHGGFSGMPRAPEPGWAADHWCRPESGRGPRASDSNESWYQTVLLGLFLWHGPDCRRVPTWQRRGCHEAQHQPQGACSAKQSQHLQCNSAMGAAFCVILLR